FLGGSLSTRRRRAGGRRYALAFFSACPRRQLQPFCFWSQCYFAHSHSSARLRLARTSELLAARWSCSVLSSVHRPVGCTIILSLVIASSCPRIAASTSGLETIRTRTGIRVFLLDCAQGRPLCCKTQ